MPTKLAEEDFANAATKLGCDVAAIKAVAEVESTGSGFLPDGRVKVLFEGHWFHRLTKGKFAQSHPTLSFPRWTRQHYAKGKTAAIRGAGELNRLEQAMKLDRRAALLSASYGRFQVMGFNHAICGFPSVEDFYQAMQRGEADHLAAFCGYIVSNGLRDELREHRWADFASRYNGPEYQKNHYDELLAAAYARFAGTAPQRASIAAPQLGKSTKAHKLNAIPDSPDFRDRMFEPTLVNVPPERPLSLYRRIQPRIPVLDQGREGACTGFALATVVHYLLRTRAGAARRRDRSTRVSPQMLYEMAKRYDEWPGENYEGSSARAAMKAWHKHGVCASAKWPKTRRPQDPARDSRPPLPPPVLADAETRPLGAYYRVDHRDLVAMHAALAEVEILYVTAQVHSGWDRVAPDGIIAQQDDILGAHAFAIVGYDADGFWIQNSWGPGWGKAGFARLSYEDWLTNGTDAWVARLGVPVHRTRRFGASAVDAATPASYSVNDLRPHIISIGNDGFPKESGTYGNSRDEIDRLFTQDIPRITKNWKKRRLLLYAHGGLVSEESALQRISEYRDVLLDSEIYPIAFIWHTDFWSTVSNIVRDALNTRRTEGPLDSAKDFMLDRLDDTLEPVARGLTGKASWDEMKENAILATENPREGAAAIALPHVEQLLTAGFELHLVGHSAGSIFLGPIAQRLKPITSCTLWAPACTVELFNRCYRPSIAGNAIRRFALFTLTDKTERDDNCAGIYHKSLLYLVSNAFEERFRIPVIQPEGEPILGMAKFAASAVKGLDPKRASWIQTPNAEPIGRASASRCLHHGDFDDDGATVIATLARMLGKDATGFTKDELTRIECLFRSSASSQRDRRNWIEASLPRT